MHIENRVGKSWSNLVSFWGADPTCNQCCNVNNLWSSQINEEVTDDERATRKEHLLEVAQRVQSEYSFRYVASEDDSAEDLTGLSSTNE